MSSSRQQKVGRIKARSEENWQAGSGAIRKITGRFWSTTATRRIVLYIPVPSSVAESTVVCAPYARWPSGSDRDNRGGGRTDGGAEPGGAGGVRVAGRGGQGDQGARMHP